MRSQCLFEFFESGKPHMQIVPRRIAGEAVDVSIFGPGLAFFVDLANDQRLSEKFFDEILTCLWASSALYARDEF